MSQFISPLGIRPDNLRSDYARAVPSPHDPLCGDIYFNEDASQVADRVDYGALPFNTGTVHYHRGSHSFQKGSYCGRHYELAAKIHYINEHLLPGEQKWCVAAWDPTQVVRLTHNGSAIHIRERMMVLATLDERAIQKKYETTRQRIKPCGLTVSSKKILVILAIFVSAVALKFSDGIFCIH